MPTSKHPPQSSSVLTPEEARTLEALADRIFPRTDTPGAVEIGAVNYIAIALAGDYAPLLACYRQGLGALNRYSRAKFHRPFHSLSEEQKDLSLADFEAGTAAGVKNAEFFDMVRCHVLEGVFGEPQYGGNKDMIGWRLVGFPGQQFGYADAYINRRVDLEPVAAAANKPAGEKP